VSSPFVRGFTNSPWTGRKARALEIDPTYVDVAVRRWQSYTGRAAVLAASGETFETIEEQRAAKSAAA
jgi:hypothetical protein